jgi:hypothetical protein
MLLAVAPCERADSQTATSESGSGYASGLISTPLTTLKMAVFAPMPSASVKTATAANVGLRRRPRSA